MKVLRSEASEWKCDDNTKARGKENGVKEPKRLAVKFALLLGVCFPFL
jgi:hypothetical protein